MELFVPEHDNYYHFLTESALGVYRLLQAIDQLDVKNIRIWYRGRYAEVLQLFSRHPIELIQDPGQVPSQATALVHQRPSEPDDFCPLIDLRDYLSARVHHSTEKKGIVILRRTGIREYAEHDELVEKMGQFGLPVRVVRFEAMSFAEQVRTARNTRLFICPHGAGQINMIFMPAGTDIIELCPKGFYFRHYPRIAALFGHRYVEIESNTAGIIGREPSERVAQHIRTHGWPCRRTVRAWRPDRMEMERVVRDVKSFSIDPDEVVRRAAELLGTKVVQYEFPRHFQQLGTMPG
jgi:capsular polysaccharide biosynthesis protein